MNTGKYALLEQLLPLLTAYEEEKGEKVRASPGHFAHWLLNRSGDGAEESVASADPPPYLEGEIAQYLSGLYRYARFYAKKALKHTQLESLDEFGYLITLLQEGATSKGALINANIHEVPTGTDLLKRLLRKGWIAEEADPKDRRSVKVSLTGKGKEALMGSFGQIGSIARMVSGNLNLREKMELLRVLKKLTLFHRPIFTGHRSEELEAILEAYGIE